MLFTNSALITRNAGVNDANRPRNESAPILLPPCVKPRSPKDPIGQSMSQSLSQSQGHLSPSQRRRPMLASDSKQAKGGHEDFVRGSIMLMIMKDFMVHKEFRFRPSARLNIVIGPSGSGKSAILAALCVCLAGKLAYLGRVSNFGDLVRKGKPYSEIEVHLAKSSVVESDGTVSWIPYKFKCTLHSDGSRTYKVNDKVMNPKEVERKLRKLNIRLDNMCQFLPQERIGEFSRMDKVKLLAESIKAIGSGDLYDTHVEIVKMDEENSTLEQTVESLTRKRDNTQLVLDTMKTGLARVEAREKALNDIRVMKAKRPFLEFDVKEEAFNAAKARFEEAKANQKKVQESLEPLKTALEVANQALSDLTEEQKEIEDDIRKAQHQKRNMDTDMRKTRESRQAKLDQLNATILAQSKREESIRAKEAELRRAIDERDSQMLSTNEAEIRKRIKEVEMKLAKHNEWKDGLESRRAELEREIRSRNMDSDRLKADLRKEDYFSQMLGKLSSMGGDHNFSVKLRRDIDRAAASGAFRDSITGPVIAWVKPRTQNAALAIENAVEKFVKFAFIATNPVDMRTLRDMKPCPNMTIEVPRPYEFTRDAEALAFARSNAGPGNGWLLDMFEAPEIIVSTLNMEAGLYNIFFMANEPTNAQLEAQPASVRVFTPTRTYTKRKARYTSGEVLTNSRAVFPGKILSATPDTSIRQRQAEERLKVIAEDLEKFQAEDAEIRKNLDSRRQVGAQLNQEKVTMTSNLSLMKNAATKIARLTEALRTLKADSEDETPAMVTDIWATFKREVAKVQKSSDTTQAYARTVHAAVVLKVQVDVANHAVGDAARRYDAAKAEQRNTEAEYKQAKANVIDAQNEVKKAQAILKATVVSDEDKARFAEWEDDIVLLDRRIADEEHRAELLQGDEGIVKTYEARKAELMATLKDLETNQARLSVIQSTLTGKQEEWQRSVQELVNNMDMHFQLFLERFKCCGKLELHTTGRPKDFGLAILISFRENSELRELSGTLHSGGERALSTMLYMLAMQDLTPCPFRIVDEINQGMDPVNERLLFEQIMSTCGKPVSDDSHTGRQYLVITPKLLPELKYERCTRVHIVNSGVFAYLNSLHPEDLMAKKRVLDSLSAPASQPAPRQRPRTHAEPSQYEDDTDPEADA